MMVNKSTFSKGLRICLVYNIIIILTVACNCTLADAVGNSKDITENVAIENDTPISGLSDLRIKKKEMKFLPKGVSVVDGEITDPKIQIAQIKDSLQLGIQFAVKGVASKPKRDLYPKDFKETQITAFQNMIDTNYTPALYHRRFTFTTYAPIVFRYFRDLFEIQSDNYLTSFYNSPNLKTSDPGTSTLTYYFTNDDKVFMKSLQSNKFKCIQQLLPKYCEFMRKNPITLLPTFLGLYGFKNNQVDIKLVSMNNLLPSTINMHLKFDLKGSTYKRTASNNERLKITPTYKDLDFNDEHLNSIFLMPDTLLAFLKTLKSDCDFLEQLNILNYSLLMGVHIIGNDSSTCGQAASARWERLMVNSVGMESIQADTGNFPNENCPSLRGSIPARSITDEKLLLFVGIIDILQDHGTMKIVENKYKTFLIEMTPGFPEEFSSISVQQPNIYASRFMEYMTKSVFKPIST